MSLNIIVGKEIFFKHPPMQKRNLKNSAVNDVFFQMFLQSHQVTLCQSFRKNILNFYLNASDDFLANYFCWGKGHRIFHLLKWHYFQHVLMFPVLKGFGCSRKSNFNQHLDLMLNVIAKESNLRHPITFHVTFSFYFFIFFTQQFVIQGFQMVRFCNTTFFKHIYVLLKFS